MVPSIVDGWPRPLAFVLSGGGAFGAVQVGMLRALEERGVTPDLIIGSSVGSLHGAMMATGRSDAVDALTTLWLEMDRRTVFGGRRSVVRSLVRSRTLTDFNRLGALITRNLDVDRFEDLAVPFAAVATDALSGEPELLQSGPLPSALMASCAVPGLFPAVDREGRAFVDGGVAANVPIRQAIAFGARSVICLDATPPVVASAVPRSFTGSLLHSASLMLRSQRSHAVDELANRYRIAVLPSATPVDMGSFNFHRTPELLESAYRVAADHLDSWADVTSPAR
jgi:NTE family protein